MSSNAEAPSSDDNCDQLPSYLLDYGQYLHYRDKDVRNQLRGFTTTSLCKAFIKHQVKRRQQSSNIAQNGASTLISMGLASLINALTTSSTALQDARIIVSSLSLPFLRRLLSHPKMSYKLFRLLVAISETLQLNFDIDDFVLQNETHIRFRGDANKDGTCLLRLDDLPSLIPQASAQSIESEEGPFKTLTFPRIGMPKGGLEILDHHRNRLKGLTINASNRSFQEVFHIISGGILQGLDWSNVLMAGGMALSTLLQTDVSLDNRPEIQYTDIDLYFYGLSPEEANAKVNHIYEVWRRNLPAKYDDDHEDEIRVVKTLKTITFLPPPHERRIQIMLKSVPSPTDVLLSFDIDACSIGWDGSRREVLMLPKFVRALETGYSVFSMGYVFGEHLSDRRATHIQRLLKYADRGFGLRFLPSFATGLRLYRETAGQSIVPQSASKTRHLNRYPNGEEPGLKTLKRIVYLAQDYLERFCFGTSYLIISPMEASRRQTPQEPTNNNLGSTDGEDDVEAEAIWQKNLSSAKFWRTTGSVDAMGTKPRIGLGALVETGESDNTPGSGILPDGLELLLRCCEAWRLDAKGAIRFHLDRECTSYDDLPSYRWDRIFLLRELTEKIEGLNGEHWVATRKAICDKLRLPFTSGFESWSTRRLRRQVVGEELDSVMGKQLTLPVLIPLELENFILNELPNLYPDLPESFTGYPCLIPIYNHETTNTFIPPLRDQADERGNLRYWVVTNESMWANQHPVVDQVFELLWLLFRWLMDTSSPDGMIDENDTSTQACIRHLAQEFRQRLVAPGGSDHEELGSGLPPKREADLFGPWALQAPPPAIEGHTPAGAHANFAEAGFQYPFPDLLFWRGDDVEGVS